MWKWCCIDKYVKRPAEREMDIGEGSSNLHIMPRKQEKSQHSSDYYSWSAFHITLYIQSCSGAALIVNK